MHCCQETEFSPVRDPFCSRFAPIRVRDTGSHSLSAAFLPASPTSCTFAPSINASPFVVPSQTNSCAPCRSPSSGGSLSVAGVLIRFRSSSLSSRPRNRCGRRSHRHLHPKHPVPANLHCASPPHPRLRPRNPGIGRGPHDYRDCSKRSCADQHPQTNATRDTAVRRANLGHPAVRTPGGSGAQRRPRLSHRERQLEHNQHSPPKVGPLGPIGPKSPLLAPPLLYSPRLFLPRRERQ